jgi:hypothetical protein
MAEQDIVAEIRALRASMDADARRMTELSQSLYRMVRRRPADENTSAYTTYANAWLRFSNVVGLGLRRTAVSDRLLAMVKPVEAEPEDEKKPPRQDAEPRPTPTDEDFAALYGEVLNAQ